MDSDQADTGGEKGEESRETCKVDAYNDGSFSRGRFEKFFHQLSPVSEEEGRDYYERIGCDEEQVGKFRLVVVEGQ